MDLDWCYVLDQFDTGCYITDSNRTITHWNKEAETISGYSSEDVIGSRCMDNILMHVDREGVQLCKEGMCPLADSIETCLCNNGNVFLHHKEGHRVPVRVKTIPAYDNNGNVIGGIELFWDLSNRLEEVSVTDLEKMAYNDPLTEIPNRRFIEQRLKAVELSQSIEDYVFVMMDIDHFKQVNDNYGHNVGDKVLKAVAKTLQHNLRPHDLLARWGGEEFLLLLKDINCEQAEAVCNRLRVLVNHAHVVHEADKVSVTISGGTYKPQDTDSIETALQQADQNLYKSKNEGRDQITSCRS